MCVLCVWWPKTLILEPVVSSSNHSNPSPRARPAGFSRRVSKRKTTIHATHSIHQHLKRISEIIIGILVFAFSESVFMYIVHRFGPLPAATVFSLFYGLIGFWLYHLFQRETASKARLDSITRWIIAKAMALKERYRRLIDVANF